MNRANSASPSSDAVVLECGPDGNADRDDIGRFFCTGDGVEIGAGSRPTAVCRSASVRYADKRSDEELRAYFSADDVVHVESLDSLAGERFDFLIAHHVLEHCANVVETLIEWMRLVRDGGVLFLSLPNRDTSPDFLRLRTPPAHFLFDYLLRTSEDDFESREHIAGFLWSWFDVGGLENKTKRDAAMLVAQAMHSERNDLHWHTFTIDTAIFCVAAAASVSGRHAELLFEQDGHLRRDEHRVVFRLHARAVEDDAAAGILKLREHLRETADAYVLKLLDGSIVRSLSAAHKHQPMLVENGKLRPIRGSSTPEALRAASREPIYFEPHDGLFGPEIEDDPALAHALPDFFAARIAQIGAKTGIRIASAQAPGQPQTLSIETYSDPSLPAIGRIAIDLAPAFCAGDLFDRLSASLPTRPVDFVVLDGVVGIAPDVVRLLRIATAALAPGGKLLLTAADRRYTRSACRRDSDIGDAIAAYDAACTAPSHRMRIEHYSTVDTDTSAEVLASAGAHGRPSYDPMTALRMAAQHRAEMPIECFVFTPNSMKRMLDSLSRSHLGDIERIDVVERMPHQSAFLVDMSIAGAQ